MTTLRQFRIRYIRPLALALCISLWSSSCSKTGISPANLVVSAHPALSQANITSMAIMPLVEGTGVHLGEDRLKTYSDYLVQQVESGSDFVILNPEETKLPIKQEVGSFNEVVVSAPNAVLVDARSFAQRIKAPFVLCGILQSFMEKQGYAKAGFTLWLQETASGKVLWTASFAEGSKPLTSNILEAGSADRWKYRTADEVLRQGLKEVSQALAKIHRMP